MLVEKVREALALGGEGDARLEAALDVIAAAFEAQTATLHRADVERGMLHMVAARGIPEHLQPVTRTIPFGKGMAGICAERREFVTVCNLQTDSSGVARPSAKETGVAGAIVAPIFDASGERIAGTLGVGKRGEHEYTQEERDTLAACAKLLAAAL